MDLLLLCAIVRFSSFYKYTEKLHMHITEIIYYFIVVLYMKCSTCKDFQFSVFN